MHLPNAHAPEPSRAQLLSRRGRPWSLLVILSLLLAACGGAGAPEGQGEPREGAGGPADPNPGGGGTSDESIDGPVRLTWDGGAAGYSIGRCEIVDDVVHVVAGRGDMRGEFRATLPAWDREVAHAQRNGSIAATNVGSEGAGNFELVASRGEVGTTWDWTVSGSNVEVTARMGNRMTATRDQGIAQFTEYRDVTITIECPGGPFGSGPDPAGWSQEEFFPIDPSLVRAPGSVTVEVDGGTYEIGYLSTCRFFRESVTAEGMADEAYVYLYSEPVGVKLDLLIGDYRAREEGVEWTLPDDATSPEDFPFDGSDTVRTWSGSLVAGDGSEAQATITVECLEGDGFESAGQASIVLDGVTHELDQVSTCTIDGATVDFFGQSSQSGITVVVAGGGTQLLLQDESGRQTMTPNVSFDVQAAQATWTGTVAGGRSATVAIKCG